MLPVSRAQTAGEMQESGDCGNDGERGMAAVLSSDLTQCLGAPPGGEGEGVGTAPAADQGLGGTEQ